MAAACLPALSSVIRLDHPICFISRPASPTLSPSTDPLHPPLLFSPTCNLPSLLTFITIMIFTSTGPFHPSIRTHISCFFHPFCCDCFHLYYLSHFSITSILRTHFFVPVTPSPPFHCLATLSTPKAPTPYPIDN